MSDFLSWFQKAGGVLDSSVEITDFTGMGRGAIAIEDIPVSIVEILKTSSVKMFLGRIYSVYNSSEHPTIHTQDDSTPTPRRGRLDCARDWVATSHCLHDVGRIERRRESLEGLFGRFA